MKEKLSAFIDGELDEAESKELMQAIQNDPELLAKWERYHLTRSAIHGEITNLATSDFADKVREQIEETPTVLAPNRIKQGRRLNRVTRWVGSLAIAASVAAISIIGLRTAVVSQNDFGGQTVASTKDQKGIVRVEATRWDTKELNTESELNMYLAGHNEYTPASSIQGLMPYVYVVGYDSDR